MLLSASPNNKIIKATNKNFNEHIKKSFYEGNENKLNNKHTYTRFRSLPKYINNRRNKYNMDCEKEQTFLPIIKPIIYDKNIKANEVYKLSDEKNKQEKNNIFNSNLNIDTKLNTEIL